MSQGIPIRGNNAIMGSIMDTLFVGAPASIRMCCSFKAVQEQDNGGTDGLRHTPKIHK